MTQAINRLFQYPAFSDKQVNCTKINAKIKRYHTSDGPNRYLQKILHKHQRKYILLNSTWQILYTRPHHGMQNTYLKIWRVWNYSMQIKFKIGNKDISNQHKNRSNNSSLNNYWDQRRKKREFQNSLKLNEKETTNQWIM